MRGDDEQLQAGMFSYIALEERIPKNHPLRGIRQLVDEVLKGLSPEFDRLYAKVGRRRVSRAGAQKRYVRVEDRCGSTFLSQEQRAGGQDELSGTRGGGEPARVGGRSEGHAGGRHGGARGVGFNAERVS